MNHGYSLPALLFVAAVFCSISEASNSKLPVINTKTMATYYFPDTFVGVFDRYTGTNYRRPENRIFNKKEREPDLTLASLPELLSQGCIEAIFPPILEAGWTAVTGNAHVSNQTFARVLSPAKPSDGSSDYSNEFSIFHEAFKVLDVPIKMTVNPGKQNEMSVLTHLFVGARIRPVRTAGLDASMLLLGSFSQYINSYSQVLNSLKENGSVSEVMYIGWAGVLNQLQENESNINALTVSQVTEPMIVSAINGVASAYILNLTAQYSCEGSKSSLHGQGAIALMENVQAALRGIPKFSASKK